MNKNKVKFSKFEDGEVIAFLLGYPNRIDKNLVMSYMRVGQHGDADVSLMNELESATPEEYEDLKLELEDLGYIVEAV